MGHLFLSYSSRDRPRAQLLAHALELRGWLVWCDRQIPAGARYDEVIRQRLDEAVCIVVLWTESSVTSDWVKEEAEVGRQRQSLVPILLDDVRIPLGFGRIQCVDLVGWAGDERAAGLDALHTAITHVAKPAVARSEVDCLRATQFAATTTASAKPNRAGALWHGRSGTLGAAVACAVLLTGSYLALSTPTIQSLQPGGHTAPHAKATQFVSIWMDASNSGADALLSLYADRVDYYDAGIVGLDAIAADKRRYYRRWPKVEQVLSGPVEIAPPAADGTVRVRFEFHYDVRDPTSGRSASGRARHTLVLANVTSSPRIVGEKQALVAD